MPRAKPDILIGFSDTQKGYILLDLTTQALFVNMDVTFREDIFPFKDSQSTLFSIFLHVSSSTFCDEVPPVLSPFENAYSPLH